MTSSNSKRPGRSKRAFDLMIAAVALVASVLFMVVVSVSGVARWEGVAEHGPIVKATTTTTIAGGGLSTVR